ncbi:MAG TPA: hypothetical protein VMZ91_02455 [Candidatus Paceibacterota bacterium]|nr:hypothetical protein [Candidatus Paceibacterota bacterium]
MPETQSQGLVPYQEGDFVKERDSITGRLEEVAFLGPIYHVTYPSRCDPIQEMFDWTGEGYRMPLAFSYNAGEEFTLVVMGDIHEDIQSRFRQAGVKITLSKPRGQREPLNRS